VGRGYVHLEETDAFPWPAAPNRSGVVRGHEFHYSSLENLAPDVRCAYTVKRGHGIDGHRDGLVVGNVLASYAHLRHTGDNGWAARFVEFARRADFRRRGEDNIVYLPPARSREALVI
jgi:cobyrinic acid a,c-diamide synthase